MDEKWVEADEEETKRLITYHDSMCNPNCGSDISYYPIPPDDWEPDVNA